MAKKKTGKNDIDNELDFGDLDGIDSEADFGELEDIDNDRNPSKAGIAKELGKEAGKGFLDGIIKQTAKKSLPDEYSNNYYELMDYADFAKNTFDENKSKVDKSIYKLGKEVKKILPFQFKALDNYLGKFESDYEQFKQETEENIREGAIQSNITSIFDKQLEVQKAIEAKRDADRQVEAKERITTNKLNFDILSSIDNNISNQTAFTLQISKEYFRKSLELQYKSYFIQADMLKTMRDSYKGFSIQLDNVVKNTGLPEFVKLNNTERISEVIRNQTIQSTYNKLFANSKYVQGLKTKAAKLIDEKVSSVTDKVDAVTDQLSMINSASEMGGSGAGMIGGILSNLLGSTIGEKLGDKISSKISPKLKDNKYINTGANYMSMLGNSPSTLLSLLKSKADKKKSEYTDESDPLRFLASKMFGGVSELLGVAEPGKQEFNVKGSSILNHNKPALFDNKAHRSITEVIPMYLAKMLKENTDLRRMYQQVNKGNLYGKNKPSFTESHELHYDYEGRDLTTADKLRKNVEKSILTTSSSKDKLSNVTGSMIGNTLSELSKNKNENKASIKIMNDKKTKKLLEDYFAAASSDNSIKFDYKTLVEDAVTPGKSNAKIEELLKGKPELIDILTILKDNKNKESTPIINERMKDIKRAYPISGIKELIVNASKLANSKIFNSIKDDQAEKLSKSLTRFIIDVGRDISIDNISSGECFKFVTEADFKELSDIISILISDVKTIKASDDILRESSLSVLLGVVNRSLKDNFELDPEVFQTLYEYSPILGNKGKLSLENLIERKLGNSSDTNFVSLEDLRGLVRTTKTDIVNKRTEIVKNKLLESITNYTSDIGKQLSEAGNNPFAIGRVIIEQAKKASNNVINMSKAKYQQASKKVDELKDTLSKLTDDTVYKSLNVLVKKLDETVISIDEMIKTEEAAKQEELKNLSDSKDKLTEVVNDPSGLKDIQKAITKTTKYYDGNISVLNKLKDTLKNKRDTLIRLSLDRDKNKLDLIKSVKTEIQSALEKLRELISISEKTEAALT